MPSQQKLIKQGIKYTDKLFQEIINRLTQGVKYSDTLESFLEKTKEYTINLVQGTSDEARLKNISVETGSLRTKFNHFSNVANITPSVVEKSLFKKKYLYKYFDRVDLPAYTTVDYIDFLNKNFSS